MRPRILLAIALSAFAVLPACAADDGEDVASEDAALEADFGEFDEDATPLGIADRAEALGDENDAVDEAVDADETPEDTTPPAPSLSTPPPLPASCNKATSLDLVVYSEGGLPPILKALGERAKPCSRYTISIPKVGGSAKIPDSALFPRQQNGKGVRAYGDQFIASAELHWGGAHDKKTGQFYPGWKNVKVVKDGPAQYHTVVVKKSEVYDNDWFLKGVLFRQRMAKRGFRPQYGDNWHINELESVWTRTRVQQKAIRDLVRGLAAGDQEYDATKDTDPAIVSLSPAEKDEITKAARVKDLRGVVFISALMKRRPNEPTTAQAENALKQTLRHRRFWADMANYVSSFAAERYAGVGFCGRNLADQTDKMQEFIMQLDLVGQRIPRYKSGKRAGESPVATALSYLSRAYHPVVSAAWGFQQDGQTQSKIEQLVRGQVYATRQFANHNRTPDNRIGIYFKTKDDPQPASPAVTAAFADSVARALNGAYDGKDGDAIGACGTGGAQACACGD